jgi:hypothetical protein
MGVDRCFVSSFGTVLQHPYLPVLSQELQVLQSVLHCVLRGYPGGKQQSQYRRKQRELVHDSSSVIRNSRIGVPA